MRCVGGLEEFSRQCIREQGTRSLAKRKLTTIFCADAQSYGKMMAHDEARTLERLQRYRAIMDGCFAKRDGRKVNTWGDALIGEFSSVVEAVRCAVEVQEAINAENRALPPEEQMWFRIGINLGDVLEDNGDIYGDGVNMAARLESLAEPGGILVSESVYNFTHKQLAIGFDFAGEQVAKANEDPVKGYHVRMGENRKRSREEEPLISQSAAGFVSADDSGFTQGGESAGFLRRWLRKAEAFLDWFPHQERPVRVSVAMIGFFLAINVLFTGIADPWFIFPSLPFAVHLWLYFRKNRRKSPPSEDIVE